MKPTERCNVLYMHPNPVIGFAAVIGEGGYNMGNACQEDTFSVKRSEWKAL